jgi:hypothetical protein
VRSKTVSLWPRKQSGERQSSRKNSVQKFGLPESKSLARGRHVASLLTAQVEVSRQPGVRTWSTSTSAGVKRPLSVKNCSTCVSHDVNSVVLPRPFPSVRTRCSLLTHGWQCSCKHLLTYCRSWCPFVDLSFCYVTSQSIRPLWFPVYGTWYSAPPRAAYEHLVSACHTVFFCDLLRWSMIDSSPGSCYSRPSRAVAESRAGAQYTDKR